MPAHRKPLPEGFGDQLFTRARAVREGVTPAVLRGPGVTTLVRGVYLPADAEPTLAQRLGAYLIVLPDETAVDGVTALHWWGVEVGEVAPYRFVTTAAYRSKLAAVRVRRVRTLPRCRDLALEPVAALVAAKQELGLRDLVVAGDWVIRAKHATLPEVQAGLAAATGQHSLRAHRAAKLVRPGAESPRETRLRLLVVLAGLPEPEGNVELGDDSFFIGRVDLYLRAWNVALEYEGDQHRTDAKTYGRDLVRSEQLTASGVLVIRVSKEHLRRPREVVRRIHAALVSRGYDGPAPVFGPDWCEAFGE